jgi:hypothetical protein
VHLAADHRRDDGRDGQDHTHQRQDVCGGVAAVAVAYDRAGDDRDRRDGDRLHATRDDQRSDTGGERARGRSQDEDREADQERRPAPIAVR